MSDQVEVAHEGHEAKNGFATASLVLGILSVCLFWSCLSFILSPIGFGLGVPGLIIGIRREKGLVMSIFGLVLNLLGVILTIVGALWGAVAFSEV